MSRVATEVLGQQAQPKHWSRELAKQAAIVISASLFVAVCARVTVVYGRSVTCVTDPP